MGGGNVRQIGFGPIVFTRAEISFFNTARKKGIVRIYGTCSGQRMKPIEVSAILDTANRYCANLDCQKEIFCFIHEAEVNIVNYLPVSSELDVRVKIVCECGTVKEFPLLLSLEKEED